MTAAKKDLKLALLPTASYPRTMAPTFHHGIGSCVLQLSTLCLQKPVSMPDTEASNQGGAQPPSTGVFSVDQNLKGLVMSHNSVPAFCFCGLARTMAVASSAATASTGRRHIRGTGGGGGAEQPVLRKDGEPGGYSIAVYVASKPILLLHRTVEYNEDGADNAGSGGRSISKGVVIPDSKSVEDTLSPLNLRAMLQPLRVDVRLCPAKWNDADAGDASTQFADESDCSFPGFQVGLHNVLDHTYLVKERVARASDGVEEEKVSNVTKHYNGVYLMDSWISFGEGVPEDNAHTIPYREYALSASSSLPHYRLLLVRDLLKKSGQMNHVVGK